MTMWEERWEYLQLSKFISFQLLCAEKNVFSHCEKNLIRRKIVLTSYR